jgi:hypothetical protein
MDRETVISQLASLFTHIFLRVYRQPAFAAVPIFRETRSTNLCQCVAVGSQILFIFKDCVSIILHGLLCTHGT